jgi:TonB family protein
MMRIVSQAPPPPSSIRADLPQAVDVVVDKVLAKKPEERYASCSDFAKALRGALLPMRARAVVDAATVVDSKPILVPPAPAPVPVPAPHPAPRPRPVVVAAPPPAPRRSGLVVLLVLFLGVNSVVLALVLWDKLGARLPWAPPSGNDAPVATPAESPSPTPAIAAEPTPGPNVVLEGTPPEGAATPAADGPAPTETPLPEPTATPAPTEVPTPTPVPALPPDAIPPVRTSDVRPAFSEQLMREHAGLDGRVELDVLVNADGSLGAISILRGVDPEVDAVVVEAARQQLSYNPATHRGRPIAARARVVVGVRFRVSPPR